MAKDDGTPLTANDLREIGFAVGPLRGTCKRNKSLQSTLRLPMAALDKRFAHADALEALVSTAEGKGAVLPAALRESAVVGLSILRGRMEAKRKELAKWEEDTDSLGKHMASLERVAKKLGEQLTVEVDGDGEKEDEE